MTQDTLHGDALLKVLSMLATDIAHERRVLGVCEAAGGGLAAIGLNLVVLRVADGKAQLLYLNVPRDPDNELGREFTNPMRGVPNMGSASPLRRAFEEQRAVFYDAGTELSLTLLQQMKPGQVESSREQVRQAVEGKGFGRGVVAPLLVHGKPWGGLCMTSNDLLESDVPALGLFAAHLGAAVEAAEVIENLEQRNRELAAVHEIATASNALSSMADARRLLEVVVRATSADAAALHRFDAAAQQFVLIGEPYGFDGAMPASWHRFSAPPGPLSQPNMSAQVQPRGEHPQELTQLGFRTLSTVLLAVEGRPNGLLSLVRRDDRPFSPSEIRTAETLGLQVSIVIERTRLQDEAARRVRQLSLLYEMTNAGIGQTSARPVTDQLLAQMLDAFPADLAAVRFVEGSYLRLVGYQIRPGGVDGPPSEELVAIDGETKLGQIVISRKALRVSQQLLHPPDRLAQRMGWKHMMGAPLLANERLVGVLSVARRSDTPFTDEELRLLESCAVHVAIILEHMRLYEDLKKSYDALGHTQAELVRHERLAALGELSAVMAHEVRNPLGVIFNSLTALKRILTPSPDVEMLLQMVGEEADRLNRIVGDLLDFARPYEAVKKPISLEPIIASAIDAAMSNVQVSNARVVTEFPDVMPRFYVDGHLVRQALINLVVNAVQAMPRGGTVTVRAEEEESQGQVWARIAVRDEGVGISIETAERIFQPFFTTKATGTGLGLAVVKRIVDAHHGEVRVETQAGGGTTFVVRLPGGESGDDDAPTLIPIPKKRS